MGDRDGQGSSIEVVYVFYYEQGVCSQQVKQLDFLQRFTTTVQATVKLFFFATSKWATVTVEVNDLSVLRLVLVYSTASGKIWF